MLDSVHSAHSPAQALLQHSAQMLRPLVRLLLANGVTWRQLTHVLKDLYLEEARRALLADGRRDTDSALTLLTGVHRKEIRQRSQTQAQPLPDLSLASQVFTRWLADPQFRAADGSPSPLPRNGDSVSFESLARSVSRDIHPRTILDELLRLGLVSQQADERLLPSADAFVPRSGLAERLCMLAANVGDHLAAGAHNLQHPDSPLLEQGIFADRLHQASVDQLQQRARQIWQHHFAALVAEAAALCEIDEPRGGQQRIRFGVYFYSESMDNPAEPAGAPAAHHGKESK